MEQRRVLIADDDEDAATSLGDLLTVKGYDVIVAFDGPSALAAAARQRPHVVLIEIGMQSGGGYETCRRLRAESWGRRALIVALSAWTRQQDRVDAYRSGCNLYLFKPVELHVLENLLGEPCPQPGAASPRRTIAG
jgi:DNA-binding response OmpR family regulator